MFVVYFTDVCVLLTSRYPKRFRKALSQAWLHEQMAPFQYFGILAPLGLCYLCILLIPQIH